MVEATRTRICHRPNGSAGRLEEYCADGLDLAAQVYAAIRMELNGRATEIGRLLGYRAPDALRHIVEGRDPMSVETMCSIGEKWPAAILAAVRVMAASHRHELRAMDAKPKASLTVEAVEVAESAGRLALAVAQAEEDGQWTENELAQVAALIAGTQHELDEAAAKLADVIKQTRRAALRERVEAHIRERRETVRG